MANITMNAKDAISAKLAECYVTIENRRFLLMQGKDFEAKFDTEALLTMMERKVLEPIGYDFSGILIQYTETKRVIPEMQDTTRFENKEGMPEGIQML